MSHILLLYVVCCILVQNLWVCLLQKLLCSNLSLALQISRNKNWSPDGGLQSPLHLRCTTPGHIAAHPALTSLAVLRERPTPAPGHTGFMFLLPAVLFPWKSTWFAPSPPAFLDHPIQNYTLSFFQNFSSSFLYLFPSYILDILAYLCRCCFLNLSSPLEFKLHEVRIFFGLFFSLLLAHDL